MELHIKYHNKILDCDAKIEKEKQVEAGFYSSLFIFI